MSKGLLRAIEAVVGKEGVLSGVAERLTYVNDAYTLERATPLCTALPESTAQAAQVVKLCVEHAVPFGPRGAGTGLSGGVLIPGGVLIGLSRMTRILEIDVRNRFLTAEAGAVNYLLSRAVDKQRLQYAPDPSSQGASTLGGNIGNNAGGPHTLKYGVTANHLLALEVILPSGAVVEIGDRSEDAPGYDLPGIVCGSEGTMGIVTKATVRLSPVPESVRTLLAVFETVDDATETVTAIIASGIMPAALEMMDNAIIQAVEDAFGYGFPRDAGAALIIELDGYEAGLDRAAAAVDRICSANSAREIRSASDPLDRSRLWAARKKAVGTLGRLAPSCVTQDCVIPRSRLPQMLREIAAIAASHELRIANVFHAGDGNLHPLVLFDARDPLQVRRVLAANKRIIEISLKFGGALSGEHGIGIEKRDAMPLLFGADTLEVMIRLRNVFNPTGLCNPNKVLPVAHGCSFEGNAHWGAIAA